MHPRGTSHLFSFTIEKTASEIKEKAGLKILAISKKIEERQGRVARLREEYQIDDGALVQLLTAARRQAGADRFSYTTSNSAVAGGTNQMEEKTIGAGVVNNLLTESDFIESEKADVRKLNLVIRNLRPLPRFAQNGMPYAEDSFALSDEELEFLGF